MTVYLKLKGPARWVKNKTPDEKYSNYSVDLCPDTDSLAAMKKSGLGLKPKQDEEGTWYKFRRPVQKIIKDDLVKFGPPKTVGPDGEEFTEIVGNGSEVELDVAVYQAGPYIGHRLERIKVLKHVPYVKKIEGMENVFASQNNIPLPDDTVDVRTGATANTRTKAKITKAMPF